MPNLPTPIISILTHFSTLFCKRKSWATSLTLLIGVLLCQGGRTVCSALRIMGLKGEKQFEKYHRILNRVKWKPLEGSKILYHLLNAENEEPIDIAIDEHIERRSGKCIKAKGCYRDPIRSTTKKVVNCFGLKWITVMIIKKFSWSWRSFAMPFMTVLAASEESNKNKHKQHKTTMDWAIQVVKQIRRWDPSRTLYLIADGGFACAKLCWNCLKYDVSLISRLRMDARLFALPSEYHGRGRPPKRGSRLLKPKEMFNLENLDWSLADVLWYGGEKKAVLYLTFNCLWLAGGGEPIPIRVVLVKSPLNGFEPSVLMSPNVLLSGITIIEKFISRFNQEITHREVRDYLGVETQRQWSDLAIARTTPILFGLYSLVLLMAKGLNIIPEVTAWYAKDHVTFSDIFKEVRKAIWGSRISKWSGVQADLIENPFVADTEVLLEALSKAS